MLNLLLVCGLLAPAHAATFVVAAGVETYDDARISSLKYAVADATSIAATFRASGVPRENVTLLTSERREPQRASRGSLLAALQRVRDKAEPGDCVIFFFAGHGVEEGEEQYLLTVDTRRDLMRETALPMSLVNRALTGLQASKLLFLLDACRNAPDAARGDEDAELTESLMRGVRPRVRLETATTGPDLVATLLSCDVGQRAYEEPAKGHGIFTLCLLDGLRGKAAGEDGQVRLSGLVSFVAEEMQSWCARSGRLQTPRLVNPGGGDMVLLKPPEEPLVSLNVRNATLAEVVSELAAQAEAQIALGTGVDPQAKVTGRLEMEPLSTVLKVLLLAHHLTVRREGEAYIIEAPQVTPVAPVLDIPSYTAADPKPEGWPEFIPWPPVDTPGLRFRVFPKDGMPQVFIPAGEFLMGSSPEQVARVAKQLEAFNLGHFREQLIRKEREQGSDSTKAFRELNRRGALEEASKEQPQRSVWLSAYWIDLHEVTNRQFQAFLQATGLRAQPISLLDANDRGNKQPWNDWLEASSAEHPAAFLSWRAAATYAAWVGRELPTEAQWEAAARGGTVTLYPWGDEPDPSKANGDWAWDGTPGAGRRDSLRGLAALSGAIRPVGSYPPNHHGLFDVIGNVWEWCRDAYIETYYAAVPDRDPFVRGEPVTGNESHYRSVRGGDFESPFGLLRPGSRVGVYWAHSGGGFRCVSPEP